MRWTSWMRVVGWQLPVAAAIAASAVSATASWAASANADVVFVDTRHLVADPATGPGRFKYVVVIDLFANDGDDGGRPLVVSSGPTKQSGPGSLTRLAEGVYRFEALAPLKQPAKFTYSLSGVAGSVEVTIQASEGGTTDLKDKEPVQVDAIDDRAFSAGGGASGSVAIDVLANDVNADELELAGGAQTLTTAKGGSITISRSPGLPPRLVFTPGTGFTLGNHSGDSFVYTAINSDSGNRDTATVTVSYQGPVILDFFNSGANGSLLRGRVTTKGGREWTIPDESRKDVLVHSNGAITTTTSGFANNSAWVAFGPSDFGDAGFEVELWVDPGQAEYVNLVFGRAGGLGQANHGELALRLWGKPNSASGKVELFGRGGHFLGSRTKGNWPAPDAHDFCTGVSTCSVGIGQQTQALNSLRLRYERGPARVSAWVNGTRVFDRVAWAAPPGDTVGGFPHQKVESVGFFVSQPGGSTQGAVTIDQFTVGVGSFTSLPLSISSQPPTKQVIPAGGEATISLTATGGLGKLQYLWWVSKPAGGAAPVRVWLRDTLPRVDISGAATPTFTVQDDDPRVEADYWCLVMDEAGERVVSRRSTLDIDQPPQLSSIRVGVSCTVGPCPCPGPTCSFTATATDPEGSSLAYSWNFGDGGVGQGATTSHAYAGSGLYTVTAVVTDAAGQTAQRTVTVRPDQPPQAVIAWPITCQGGTCTFDGTRSSDGQGPIASYIWSFGDGKTATGATVNHTYTQGGPRTVTLTVTDQPLVPGTPAQSSSTSVQLAVDLPPVAVIGAVSCEDLTCTFSGGGSSDPEGGPIVLDWSFGDGGTAQGTTATHEFPQDGSFTVTLVVSDAAGNQRQVTKVVTVEDLTTLLLLILD